MQMETGAVVDGEILKITKHGAIVKLSEGKTGFVHISEIADAFVASISDYLAEGDKVKVKVLGYRRDQLELSYKQAGNPVKTPVAAGARKLARGGGRVFNGLPSAPAPSTFEDKLKSFMRLSEEKLGELKRNIESKRGGGRHRL